MVNYRTVRFLTQWKKANTNIWASELGMAVKGHENAFDRLVKLGLIFSPNIYATLCSYIVFCFKIFFLFRGKLDTDAKIRIGRNYSKIYNFI